MKLTLPHHKMFNRSLARHYSKVPCWKKAIEPCPKLNRKCNGFNGSNGNCIGINRNYNVSIGMWWILLVGCSKRTRKENFVMFCWEKLMVHKGILMETIRIYVMVSIGLLLQGISRVVMKMCRSVFNIIYLFCISFLWIPQSLFLYNMSI